MSSQHPIDLRSFLRSPRSGMSRLNGWQRLWWLCMLVLLASYLFLVGALIQDFYQKRFEPALYAPHIAEMEAWEKANQAACIKASEDADQETSAAKQMHADITSQEETAAKALIAST